MSFCYYIWCRLKGRLWYFQPSFVYYKNFMTFLSWHLTFKLWVVIIRSPWFHCIFCNRLLSYDSITQRLFEWKFLIQEICLFFTIFFFQTSKMFVGRFTHFNSYLYYILVWREFKNSVKIINFVFNYWIDQSTSSLYLLHKFY